MKCLYAGGCYYGPNHRALVCWSNFPQFVKINLAFRLIRPTP